MVCSKICGPICRSNICQKFLNNLLDSVNVITRVIGVIFIGVVFILLSLVTTYFYYCFIPYQYEFKSIFSVLFHLVFGNWLLINIIFHYYNATKMNPGIVINTPKVPADEVQYMRDNYSYRICKHCSQVKPPRTYHCSVCASCILKMEHHCPWINNCVGMMNHKFYLLFCWFLWVGTFYVMTATWPLFKHCYRLGSRHAIEYNVDLQNWMMMHTKGEPHFFRTVTIFAWIICLSVFIALGILTIWQSWLVSTGETSVERMKLSYDRTRAKKAGKEFHSPFNFGLKRNWQNTLGFNNKREFCLHVLLPSRKRGDECLENKKYTLKPENLL